MRNFMRQKVFYYLVEMLLGNFLHSYMVLLLVLLLLAINTFIVGVVVTRRKICRRCHGINPRQGLIAGANDSGD